MSSDKQIIVRRLGMMDYHDSWQRMQAFTDSRDVDTADEIWFLQHPPVYTLGKNGKAGNILNAGNIPVINSDRGGQVTYHGPGQIVVYMLLDLTRLKLGVRQLVTVIENAVIGVLGDYAVKASAKPDAPGVYVNGDKIAALGLRVRKGRSFHGLSLNIDMDLEPFSRIHPCGHKDLKVVQLKQFVPNLEIEDVSNRLEKQLLKYIGSV